MWLAVENVKILYFVIQARRFQHILSKICWLKWDMAEKPAVYTKRENGVQKQPLLQLLWAIILGVWVVLLVVWIGEVYGVTTTPGTFLLIFAFLIFFLSTYTGSSKKLFPNKLWLNRIKACQWDYMCFVNLKCQISSRGRKSAVRERLAKYVKYKAFSFFIFFPGLAYWSHSWMDSDAQ